MTLWPRYSPGCHQALAKQRAECDAAIADLEDRYEATIAGLRVSLEDARLRIGELQVRLAAYEDSEPPGT